MNPSDFTISHIEKGIEENTREKLIKISGTFKGHDVTLIITLNNKSKRDDIIKKIKANGLTITKQFGDSTQFLASTGSRSVLLNVQVASKEKSFNISQIVGSKLLLTREVSKKVAEKHFSNRKGGYAALEGSPATPDLEKGKVSLTPDKSTTSEIPISHQLKPLATQPPRSTTSKASDIPISHQLKPLPTRPPPRSATSMADEVVKCPYFRAEFDPMTAAKALMDPRNVPGTVIVTKSFNTQHYPFVATVKLPDGTVSQNLISIDKTAPNTVYRVSDEHGLVVKVGAGAGYATIVECLAELSRSELARVPPKPPTPLEKEMIQFRAGLHERAGHLFQELQGLKTPLQEMGCNPHELDAVLSNLCYNIAAFERSGQKGFRIRKKVSAFQQLGAALPFTCYLDAKLGSQGVIIHMTTPGIVQGATIGQGTYKIVKTNYDIDIPPTGSSQKPSIQSQEVALIRAKKGFETDVIKGSNLMKQLREEIGPDVIPAIFAERRFWSKSGKERYEYNQFRFHGDFDKVIRQGQLPLRTASAANPSGPAGMKKFSFEDKLNALIDVTGKISRFHAAGYIHRDIKPPNMLIQFVGQPPRTVAIPADYDLTRKAGYEAPTLSGRIYPFWDPCARAGIITPNCDVFGLTYSLGMTLFPNFIDIVGSRTQLDVNKDFAPLMYNKVFGKLTELGLDQSPATLALRIKMGSAPPHTEYCRMVNEELNQICLQQNVPIEKVNEIRQFQAELTILLDMWRLIGRVVNISAEMQRDVLANQTLMQKLQSADAHVAREAANEVTQMAALKGLPSAEELETYLKFMQQIMSSSTIV